MSTTSIAGVAAQRAPVDKFRNLFSPFQLEVTTTVVSYALALALLWTAVFRIDFHADEALYLANVPVSLSNDTGLVYHFTYLLGSLGAPTPGNARVTSLVIGMLCIGFVTSAFQCWLPRFRALLPALVALVVTVSYQGIFLILRVRPELSWVTVSAMVVCFLAYAETTKRPWYMALALVSLLILPMNHRMSWFPCAFLVLYLPLFASRSLGWKFAISGMAAMALGAVLNVVLRAWLRGDALQHAFGIFLSSNAPGVQTDIATFFAEIFWKSTFFLRDTAANRSWWDRLLPATVRPSVSHYLFPTMLWASCFVLPWLTSSWRARFAISFPIFAFGMFYFSGYYNATYSSIFGLYGVLAALYVALEQQSWRRGLAITLVGLSVFNGLSFLSTRVLSHGPATFFIVEKEIREFIENIEPTASIAYPQRMMSVGMRHPGPKKVSLIDKLDEVDYLVVDDYDYEMFNFVPNSSEIRQQVQDTIQAGTLVREYHLPVYPGEPLFGQDGSGALPPSRQGAWFFRSSIAYRTVVIRATPSTAMR